MESLHSVFTIISLAMTVPAVLGCLGVVWLWSHSAWKAWQTAHRTETHWFVLGVTVGFIGSLFDNVYWSAAWAADYYNSNSKDLLFSSGVYSNTIFRQGCTAFAAFCHIRAAVETDSFHFRLWVALAWLAGIVLGAFLYFTGDL